MMAENFCSEIRNFINSAIRWLHKQPSVSSAGSARDLINWPHGAPVEALLIPEAKRPEGAGKIGLAAGMVNGLE